MGIYDAWNDGPNQIRREGQEISIKFERTSDTTAKITWTIPAPAAGCNAFDQAYDGILITVASQPANYLSTSPIDGTYYNGDPTADVDLHAGDKLDTALIIGTFYHDKTTTTLNISGIKPKTAYYFSGYAVDKVGRYHREGVHSYSLPTGAEEIGTADAVAKHDIIVDLLGGVKPITLTGLNTATSYRFDIKINNVQYEVIVPGIEAQTYGDLVKTLNKKFALLENPYQSPIYPHINEYYMDTLNGRLFQWNGFQHLEKDVKVSLTDPSIVVTGEYWFDTDDKILYIYNGTTWIVVTPLTHTTDPTILTCGQLWFDGSDIWKWDGNHFCKLCLYSQERNPALGPLLSCNTYWYQTDDKILNRWDVVQKRWKATDAIYSTLDPNTLNTGNFWYDETAKKVKQFVGSAWQITSSVRYEERNDEGELTNPGASIFWFVPSEGVLYQRDEDNLEWNEVPIVLFPTDPRDRSSCDLWWNSNPTIDDLYSWDALNSEWVPVEEFFKS